MVFAKVASGQSFGNFGLRFFAGDAGDLWRAVGFPEFTYCSVVYSQRFDAGDCDYRLWLCSVSHAGLVVARATRLSEHVREAGNDCAAGHGDFGVASRAPHASADTVY